MYFVPPPPQSQPYLMNKTKTENDDEPLLGNNRYYGYCADLAEEVAKLVGFDYELRIVRDNMYGFQLEGGGEWNGMVGELTRGVGASFFFFFSFS